jgi:hypothetical protein
MFGTWKNMSTIRNIRSFSLQQFIHGKYDELPFGIFKILSVIFLFQGCAPNYKTITSIQSLTLSPTSSTIATETRTRYPTRTKILSPTPLPYLTLTSFIPIKRDDNDNISGTYENIRSDEDYCLLLVVMEEPQYFIPQLTFELYCQGGPPLNNYGYAIKTINYSQNIAVYSVNKSCNIVFELQSRSLTITQIGLPLNCGFEDQVYADGHYLLINDNIPRLGCLIIGSDPCELKK